MGQANAARDSLYDLRFCDMSGKDASGYDLSGVIMTGTDVSKAKFVESQVRIQNNSLTWYLCPHNRIVVVVKAIYNLTLIFAPTYHENNSSVKVTFTVRKMPTIVKSWRYISRNFCSNLSCFPFFL